MFALLSLIGLALAGTALVGFSSSEGGEADDTTSESHRAPDSEVLRIEVTDMLSDLDPLKTPETDLPSALTESPNIPSADEAANAIADGAKDVIGPLVNLATDGADIVVGGEGDDELNGLSGDDYMNGAAGNDIMLGGNGLDQMHGGAGDDRMSGDAGDDIVLGYIGDDDLSGGDGHDKLHGGDGDDLLDGGYDDDELLGGYGDDILIGGAGRDMLQGSEGDDLIDGVTGEEGGAEKDYLNGSEGMDHLIGNDTDVMSGGEGNDTFEIANGTVSIMDFSDDDLLILRIDGPAPALTTLATATGTTLLADGLPVASLFGVNSFDVSTVQFIAT